MLHEVINLKIQVNTEQDRFLDDDERKRAMRRLRSGKDITPSKGKDNKPANTRLMYTCWSGWSIIAEGRSGNNRNSKRRSPAKRKEVSGLRIEFGVAIQP